MENHDTLSRHGLFNAKVPRYTSYPPANHFQNDVGRRQQVGWLQAVPDGATVSLYIHIPFCKRLCWFCACRTQGTKTLRPVDAYVEVLRAEIAAVRGFLAPGVRMGRLHLGGGTPTILSPATMNRLLDTVFQEFERSDDFEFSVEIDPTEASRDLLRTLINRGMNRASIGVQDFDPMVQVAIGRPQTLAQTWRVVDILRSHDVEAINFDLLYGLPHQTADSFRATLDHVLEMQPQRLAIYGYAHVPWMSKRQVMIRAEDLPDTPTRFALAEQAHDALTNAGYAAIGIDHFARPSDSLFVAQQTGRLRRNFQGYTDDQSETLIGFGASAISQFPQGFQQNAVATSAYQERILDGALAGHKGYVMGVVDQVIAAMIAGLMCEFTFSTAALTKAFPEQASLIRQTAVALMARFDDVFRLGPDGLTFQPGTEPLVRIVASFIDTFAKDDHSHAAAI